MFYGGKIIKKIAFNKLYAGKFMLFARYFVISRSINKDNKFNN